jgi:hypothetical protein
MTRQHTDTSQTPASMPSLSMHGLLPVPTPHTWAAPAVGRPCAHQPAPKPPPLRPAHPGVGWLQTAASLLAVLLPQLPSWQCLQGARRQGYWASSARVPARRQLWVHLWPPAHLLAGPSLEPCAVSPEAEERGTVPAKQVLLDTQRMPSNAQPQARTC